MNSFFDELRRQQFRRYYQPTRILLGLVESGTSSINVITLCFSMTCSYKPPLMAIAVHRRSYSYQLFSAAREFVLAVPGEKLAREALFCGVESGREVDKIRECALPLVDSKTVRVPGLESAIANLELLVRSTFDTGDHRTIIGEVRRYAVNTRNQERNLLSVGPQHDGYEILAAKGIHRIAVVKVPVGE
jgi:flavin reductase (DIM6/NTAB) family NADH-FMN oxidoreductase RutF